LCQELNASAIGELDDVQVHGFVLARGYAVVSRARRADAPRFTPALHDTLSLGAHCH
jgi:hypothetical protein